VTQATRKLRVDANSPRQYLSFLAGFASPFIFLWMSSRYIIHTVGPVYMDTESVKKESAELLASCYRTSLELAAKHDLKHIVRHSLTSYASSE